MSRRIIILTTLLLFHLVIFPGCNQTKTEKSAISDVVIYGGTSSAVIAAVQLARMDRTVVLVCPDIHLGGLSAGGLGYTDIGNKEVIGGLSREYYQRIYEYYQEEESWKWQAREEYGNKGQGTAAIEGDKRTMWNFEPHVAEQVFEDFVSEYKIQVFRDNWLDRENGVEMKDGRIVSISMLNGKKFEGNVFIDATYEGDLMAAAGVSYHVGREANTVYDEEWNGIQLGVLHHGHHFADRKISPFIIPDNPSSGVLPKISTDDPGVKGEGDHRVQAYCFRLCCTKVEDNKVAFEKPENYDPAQYELLLRILDDGWRQTFRKFDPIPNLKTDVNNHGPFGFDNIGMNYDYPEGSYEERKEIIKEHENYQKGLLYFYANDPRVPEEIQKKMKEWGLAKDEFKDNGHWPHQIYVREARRMIGDFVMTENEVQGKSPVPKPIGMGSYTMDSHNTQRYITPEGYVQNEGDIGVHPKQPYQIDLGSILPRKEECNNLLVPLAVSSSHIAFGSIRMEPVFMILGQSAAVVAGLALRNDIDLHAVIYPLVKAELIEEGQVISYSQD